MWENYLRKISEASHRITLSPSNNDPIHATFDLAGPREHVFEKKEANQMVKAGAAKLKTTEWESLVVFVPKKNKFFSVCFDYCRLNAVTKKDSHSIP